MVKTVSCAEAHYQHSKRYAPLSDHRLKGARSVLKYGEEGYPDSLVGIPEAPHNLYVIGNSNALRDGLAIVGARKATPYGRAAARRFAQCAAEHGIPVISGGALGCDSCAHEGALSVHGETVVVLGGGCDRVYPERNFDLFQRVIDKGGAVISEQLWDYPPMPYTFRLRNRIIAGLARATLIVEAGLPSGTFSTADDALAAGREVMVVPGPISSPTSKGANRLIYQGATPIVDEATFEDELVSLFGCLRIEDGRSVGKLHTKEIDQDDNLLAALLANPMTIEQLLSLSWEEHYASQGEDKLTWLMVKLALYERDGLIARFPDGRYGPTRV